MATFLAGLVNQIKHSENVRHDCLTRATVRSQSIGTPITLITLIPFIRGHHQESGQCSNNTIFVIPAAKGL